MKDFSHQYARRENRRESTRLHVVVQLEARMTRHFLHISLLRIAARPVKITEIVSSLNTATYVRLRIDGRNHNGIMWRGEIHYTYHATPSSEPLSIVMRLLACTTLLLTTLAGMSLKFLSNFTPAVSVHVVSFVTS